MQMFGTAFAPKPLRPHQEQAIAMLRQSIKRGNKRVVVQMPTGAGKTRTAAEIVNGALSKGSRVCFTVPAISLVDQTVEAFAGEGIDEVGVIQASHPMTHYGMPVQIASVQSLARRGLPNSDVVIVDECHLRFKVISDWMAKEPRKLFIGLSATPWARGMADDWQDLVTPVRMAELMEAGFLSPFRVFAPSHPDLTGVKTVAGDYHEGQLGEVMSDKHLVADVVDTWLKLSERRPTLVFAVNRAHAGQLQAQFAERGIEMGYCDAFTERADRQILFDKMQLGKLAGIVNVGTLTTGVDADVRCIVLARPTKSEMLFVQCIGRGLRTAPSKADCVILDHADNHARMGFVTDIHHDRLKGGSEKKEPTASEKGEPLPKECGKCGMLKPPKVRECPACGFTPTRQSEIETEAGELVAIAPKKPKKQYTMEDKQRFYSMALWVDRVRKKGGKYVKGMYKGKFDVWPQGMKEEAIEPDPAFYSYENSRRIAWAKRKRR